jgi:uncharacterized protein
VKWFVCWRACERLTGFLDALEITRQIRGLKSPSLGCSPPQGIRILRQECAPITVHDETLNLIGIDNGSDVVPMRTQEIERYRRLQQLKALVMPDSVNILLIHYPQFFGDPGPYIDLTLAGDLHGGGQLSLDFVHRGFNLARLFGVPYVRGLHEKDGAQLYMNRGIGTTGFPIRLGARPEITLLELTRT